MTERVLNNFRGARALILHADDPNRDTLALTLRRLGLLVATASPEGDPPLTPSLAACDVLFFDADQSLGPAFAEVPAPVAPHIALIGLEAPSRLARVVRHRCCGYLLKPIRPAGVFTALFIGFNEFALRQRDAREREGLADRLRGRRYLTKAILQMVAESGIDDDEAFRRLRRESMSRRVPIERVAQEHLALGEAASSAEPSRKAHGA
jgi:AmiR/NasT family two-component response regulator